MIDFSLNPYQFIGSIIVETSLLTVPIRPTIALDIGEVASLAYEITVKITDANTGYNGSGVIIKREDNTYSILSNQHVVSNGSTYKIETVDGASHSVKSQYEVPGLDLVVLQFRPVLK